MPASLLRMTASPVILEIFADYVCPWCYLGNAVAEKLRVRVPLQLKRSPFPLHASTPPEGLLLSELLERDKPALAFKPLEATVHIHGHCHQKAFGAFPAAVALLKRIPGLTVKPITSSCCGMAGAFGYQAESLEASKAMAELSLLPAVRAAGAEDFIIADGTSCRHQIGDLGAREAIHSVRLLDRALA